MNWGKYKTLYLKVYNVGRIRKFNAVYLEKGFFPNKSDIRGINPNGKTSLVLKAGLSSALFFSIVCIKSSNR